MTTQLPTRARRHWWMYVRLGVACGALCVLAGAGRPPPVEKGDGVELRLLEARLGALGDNALDGLSREIIVQNLCKTASASPEGAAALGAQMADLAARSPAACATILSYIAHMPDPPDALGEVVAACARMPGDHPPVLWTAAARFRSRAVVGALVDSLGAKTEPLVINALVHITGRDDLASDQWATWFEAHRWVSDLQWRQELVRGLSAQRDRLVASRARVLDRFVDLIRAVYLTLDPGSQRSIKLAELLRDKEPAVRQLGFDLARRELLAASGTIDASVGAAAMELLSHPDARVRAQAAQLVVQLAPPGCAEAVVEALADEQDAHAAAAMLAGVARWPSPRASAAVARWLADERDDVRVAAAQAGVALATQAMTDEAWKHEALVALRTRGVARLGDAGLRLLGAIGEASDRQALAVLLGDGDAARRHIAASILIKFAPFLSPLIEAARAHADLYVEAIHAIALHQPDRNGWVLASSLSAPNEDQRREALAALADALPAAEIVAVAGGSTEPQFRHEILSALIGRAGTAENVRACARGLLMLAEADLSLGRPADALQVLDACVGLRPPQAEASAPSGEGLVDPARVAWARAAALVATNQIDTAATLDAPIDAWIRGLELCADAEYAPAVLTQIRERFREELDATALARLDELAGEILATVDEPSGGG